MDKIWERYIQSRPAPGESKGAFDAFAAAHRDPGPRIGLQGGQLVQNTADGSRPGYNGARTITTRSIGNGIYENTSETTGKKTYYGKVQRNKKILKSPHGTEADAMKFVTEKRKIPEAKSVIELQIEKGTLLEQPKYKNALANALDDLAKMETKGYGAINEIVKKYQNIFSKVGETTVQGKIIKKGRTTESTAITSAIRSYAAENNIRDVQIKEMEKALDDYLAKKTPERGYVPKLMKKHGILETTFNSWLVELDARRKIPLKYESESERIKATRAKRAAALKKYSSSGFERWTKGTAESGLHGGHTGQIYSEEVTPKTKKFTPAKINQETLKQYDAILQGIADKRDKAFKAKNWAEVERLNTKGMNVASATEGYKTFTIKNRDGTTFEWGSTKKGAVDPMDLTKEGITAKEMESYRMGKNPEIVKAQKLLDKKLISPAEFETIRATEEAKLFAEGKNKALLDFQKSEALKSAKMSKKEISSLDKRLNDRLNVFCRKSQSVKAGGGRVGFGGECPIEDNIKYMQEDAAKLKDAKWKSKNPAEAAKIAQKFATSSRAMLTLGKASKILFSPYILWGEPFFEAAFIAHDMLGNRTPWKEAVSKSYLTMPLQAMGLMKSSEEYQAADMIEVRDDRKVIYVDGKEIKNPNFGKVTGIREGVKRSIDAKNRLSELDKLKNKVSNLEQQKETNVDLYGTDNYHKMLTDAKKELSGYASAIQREGGEKKFMGDMKLNEKAYREREEVMLTKRMEGKKYREPDSTRVFYELNDPRYKEMEEYKMGRDDVTGFMSRAEYEKIQELYPTKYKNVPYEDQPKFLSYQTLLESKPEGSDKTYKELFPTPASRYGWDLTGEVARAGGVANMAGGGLANLTRTVAPDSEGIASLKKKK